jgi:serralysin
MGQTMTIYRIDPSNPLPPVYGEGESALVIGDGDTVILGQGAEIAAYGRNGWGLFGRLGNNLVINGSVHSEWETAIAAHGAITIGGTGRVYGGDAGLQLINDPYYGRPSILNNAGIISTGHDGVAIWLHGASNVIVNSGEIRGGGGIWSYTDQADGGTFTLYNSGLISASGGGAIAAALFGSNYIVNSGHIDGSIILGSENDFYDGRDGTWSFGSGDIRLREGDDVFYGGSSQEFVHADEGNDTVDGGGGDDDLLGRSGDDFLRGGSGDDTIWGEAGVDVAAYSGPFADYTISKQADGTYLIVDHRTGLNDGADVLKTIEYVQFADRTIALASTTNSAPTSISLDDTSIEASAKPGALVGHLGGVDPDGDLLGYSLAANPGGHFRIHGDQLLVDKAFALDDKSFDIVVRASDPKGASLDMHFIIMVTASGVTVLPSDGSPEPSALPEARVLRGGRKADILAGGEGDDHLNGGLGKDRMTGGEGDDVFAFTTRLGKANVDRIVDFIAAEDTIHLSSKTFDRLAKGVLSEKVFHVGAKAHDRSDRIIFNDETGALSYDADGSGKKYAAIKFAQLNAKTLLMAADFFIA